MKKTRLSLILSFLVLFVLLPGVVSAWSDSSYIYRSTVTGSGIKEAGNHVYQIVNQQSNFSQNESVYVLTRIFNISHIDRFQFKFQLIDRYGGVSQELYSPLYQPRGNWWAETYAWHNFGRLDPSNYEIKVYINLNNSGYRYLDRKLITIDRAYYNDHDPYYNDHDPYYNDHDPYYPPYYYEPIDRYYEPEYEHNWTYTGTGVEEYGYYKYKILGRSDEFEKNENVYVLTKLSGIDGVKEFRVKHELYLHGNNHHDSEESVIYRPYYSEWDYNYNWHNFGRLPEGKHSIKVYISTNNSSYKQIASVKIQVGDEDDNYSYHYGWTKTGNRARYLGSYKYEMDNDKRLFYSDEDLRALTKLENIRGINTFQVKHELRYSGGALYRSFDSGVQRPGYRIWDYNYTETNFGKLSPGDYSLEVYVRINNGSYKKVSTKEITVKKRYYNANNTYNDNYYYRDDCYYHGACNDHYYSPSYDYAWTRLGDGTYPQHRTTAYNYY